MTEQCEHKRQVLATQKISYFNVAEGDEFYNEVWDVDAEAVIGIHYCLDCRETVDIWIEEPYQAEVFALRAEVERLRGALEMIAAKDVKDWLNDVEMVATARAALEGGER